MKHRNPEIQLSQEFSLPGANVILLSQEHTGNINPQVPPHILSKSTKAVILEYFVPELTNNTARTPLIGRRLENMWGASSYKIRCDTQHDLAELCKEAGKPVVVIDIANKPAYLVSQLGIPAMILGFGNTFVKPFSPEADSVIKRVGFLAFGMLALNLYHENRDKGLFDRKRIHGYERFLLDAVDARRVFVAAGIRQLSDEMKDGHSSEIPEIVVCYPEAHTRRIGNYLQDQSLIDQVIRKTKQLLYRTNFWLDFNIRQYKWDDKTSAWKLASKRAI